MIKHTSVILTTMDIHIKNTRYNKPWMFKMSIIVYCVLMMNMMTTAMEVQIGFFLFINAFDATASNYWVNWKSGLLILGPIGFSLLFNFFAFQLAGKIFEKRNNIYKYSVVPLILILLVKIIFLLIETWEFLNFTKDLYTYIYYVYKSSIVWGWINHILRIITIYMSIKLLSYKYTD